MTDISELSKNKEYKANVDLSYDYIEKSIKEIQSKNNDTNTADEWHVQRQSMGIPPQSKIKQDFNKRCI